MIDYTLSEDDELTLNEAYQVNDIKARFQNFLSNNRLVLCEDVDGVYLAQESSANDGTLLLARIEINDAEALFK